MDSLLSLEDVEPITPLKSFGKNPIPEPLASLEANSPRPRLGCFVMLVRARGLFLSG